MHYLGRVSTKTETLYPAVVQLRQNKLILRYEYPHRTLQLSGCNLPIRKSIQSCVSVNYPVDIVENSLKLRTMTHATKTKLHIRNENLFQLHIGTFGLILLLFKIMFSFDISILSCMEQGNMEAQLSFGIVVLRQCRVWSPYYSLPVAVNA